MPALRPFQQFFSIFCLLLTVIGIFLLNVKITYEPFIVTFFRQGEYAHFSPIKLHLFTKLMNATVQSQLSRDGGA